MESLQCSTDLADLTCSMEYIARSDVLDEKDIARLEALSDEIKHVITTHTIYRTPTEARLSVLNDVDFPTPAAKYHQAKREQITMFDNLMRLSFEYREARIDLAETEELIAMTSGYERERLIVKRDRLKYRMAWMILDAQARLKELEMWSAIKKELEQMDIFDPDDRNTDQVRSLAIQYMYSLLIAFDSTDVAGKKNIVKQCASTVKFCKENGINLPEDLLNRVEGLLAKYGLNR